MDFQTKSKAYEKRSVCYVLTLRNLRKTKSRKEVAYLH